MSASKGRRYSSKSVSYQDPATDSSDIEIDLSEDVEIFISSSSDAKEELSEEIIMEIDSSEEEEDYVVSKTKRKPKPSKKVKVRKKQGQMIHTREKVDEEHSITQGCFLVPPTRKKVTQNKKEGNLIHFSTLLLEEEGEARHLRFEAYQSQWRYIRSQLQHVRSSVYDKTFESIKTFVKSQQEEKKGNDDELEASGQLQLPTAVIIVGMNVLDHEKLLSDLVTHIEDKKTIVITLHSKDCASPSHALFSLISQCLAHSMHPNPPKTPTSRVSVNFRQLINWYKSLCKELHIPGGSITVGILLLDFECFSTEVAQLLVSICSNHLVDIPFTFVIGLATSVTTIHQMLPRSVCSRLKMEKFRFLPPNEQLKLILHRVFLDSPPIVQLGFQALQVIFNRFEEANVSIESFSRSLQFAFMEHFYKNPLSFLTLYPRPKFTSMIINALNSFHFNYIRSLPSVKKALKKLEPAKSKLLKQNDQALAQYVVYWMKNINQSRYTFSVAFLCYASLPYFSHERSKEYLHFLYLYAHHEDPLQRFHILRQSFLKKRLKRCDVAYHVLSSWKQIINESKYKEEFHKVCPAIDALMSTIESEREGTSSSLQPETFKKLRKLITRFLHQFMKPFSQFPLHEAFCYDQMRPLQEAFTPQIQMVLRQSVAHPDLYMGYISPHKLPDVCVAFSFYEENGKRINLYDWFVQFSDAISKRKEGDSAIQARYLRALTELQLLGFIQPKNSNIAERCI